MANSMLKTPNERDSQALIWNSIRLAKNVNTEFADYVQNVFAYEEWHFIADLNFRSSLDGPVICDKSDMS